MSIKIFINLTSGDSAAIGAGRLIPVSQLPEWAAEISQRKSAATAFITTEADGADDTSDIDQLDAAARIRTLYEQALAEIIDKGVQVQLRVGTIADGGIEAVPLDPALNVYGARYVMPLSEYNSRFRTDYGDLHEGTVVIARLISAVGDTVRWDFVDKTHDARGEADEFRQRVRTGRIFRELSRQAGKVFLQCRIAETTQITSARGTSEHYRVTYGDMETFAMPFVSDVDRSLELPDGSIVLFLYGTKQSGQYIQPKLSTSWGRSYGLPFSPEGGFGDRGVSAIVGRPHRFNNGKNLVTVLFDGESWQSGVFVNRMLAAREIKNLTAYPGLAYRYIALGYPTAFTLDINPDNPDRSRLLLSGLSPQLDGRLPSNVYLRPPIKTGPMESGVPMAPVALVGDRIKMSSAGYTAYMKLSKAPAPLRRMAVAGIFSPDFTVRCNVEIAVADGIYKVVCSPAPAAADMPRAGERVQPRVCAALDGVLYMMAGDVPAMAEVADMAQELAILDGTADVEWSVAAVHPEAGYLTLTPVKAADEIDPESFLAAGSLFAVEAGMTYRGLSVVNLPSGADVPEGTVMECLRPDTAGRRLVATADIAGLSSSRSPVQQRLAMVGRALEYGVLMGVTDDGRILYDLPEGAADAVILRRLHALYGDRATYVADAQTHTYAERAQWSGIACHHDYSAVRSTPVSAVAELWAGLDDDTPVLFGDICLSRRDLGITGGDARDAAAADAVDAGCELYTVVEVSTATLSVTFERDGERVTLSGSDALRLPFPRGRKAGSITPLHLIFEPGSLWALDPDDGCLRSDESDTPRVYTLVAPLQQTDGSDWVVRADDGSVALAADLDMAIAGRRVLMTTDNVLGPYVYVEEAEEHFVGRKLRLAVTGITDTALECRELTGAVTRAVELPLDRVSWHPGWTPAGLSVGTVLQARVIEARADRLVVDRRCLLRQDALIAGIKPRPGRLYQMEVAQVRHDGYMLSQNGVEAMLPLDRAAVFEITPRNQSYLRLDDLAAVTITRDGGYRADFIGDKLSRVGAWARAGVMLPFAVHHHCPDGIFVEREGIVMYVSNRVLGHWCGYELRAEYAPGSVIDLKVMETAAGRFGLGLANVPPLVTPAPAVGEVHTGTVSAVIPAGCYVRHPAGWSAFVPAARVSRLPLNVSGHPGVSAGDSVSFEVTSVSVADGCIEADIAAVQPMPGAGPGSAEPFVDTFRTVVSVGDTDMVLANPQGYLATFEYADLDATPDIARGFIEAVGALMVTGMRPDGTMAVSAKAMIESNKRYAAQIKAADPKPVVEATVIGHTKRTVSLRYGLAYGLMPRGECDQERDDVQLSEAYPLGTTVRVLVYDAAAYAAFRASQTRLRRREAVAEAAAYTPGTRLRMRITRADAAGVHGRAGKVDVLVPAAEVCLAAGVTIADWAASRTLVDVEVIDGGGDGVLLASRRRYLGDIPER